MKTEFDALLAEIDTLAKSQPKGDDARIATAAGPDAAAAVAPAGADDDQVDPNASPAAGDAPMAKSFTLKLEDGTEVTATDGEALIKSLTDRVERNETSVLAAMTGLTTLVKSLSEQVGKLSAAPTPRRAVLTVADRPAAAAPAPAKPGISGEEFMAKAMDAQAAGKLTGLQVSIAEQHINANQQPPAEIVRAVLG